MGMTLPSGPQDPREAHYAAPGVIRGFRTLFCAIFGLPAEGHSTMMIVAMDGQVPHCLEVEAEEPVFRTLVDSSSHDEVILATCHFVQEVVSGDFVYREIRCRLTGLPDRPVFEWAVRVNTPDKKVKDLFLPVTSVIRTNTET